MRSPQRIANFSHSTGKPYWRAGSSQNQRHIIILTQTGAPITGNQFKRAVMQPKTDMSSYLTKRWIPAALFLVLTLGFDSAHAKKPSIPEEFQTAKTVFVETQGGDITNLRLDPDDRNAILDTQEGVEAWGRYALSRSRYDADLIFVVTKGHPQRDTPSSGFPASTSRTPQTRSSIPDSSDASQRSPNDPTTDALKLEQDQLQVYLLQSNHKLKGPIWRGQLPRGLDSPARLLLQRLKSDVEKAYPNPPAKPSSPAGP
jgi:hypothetical protein